MSEQVAADAAGPRRGFVARHALLLAVAAAWGAWIDLPVAVWWLADTGRQLIDAGSTTLVTDDVSPLPLPDHGWHVVQWLLALLVHGIDEVTGIRGLVAAQALLVAGLAAAFAWLAESRMDPLRATQVAAIAVVASRPVGLDGQTVATLLAALLFAALLRGRWWWALPILALWSNVHASVAIGLLLTSLAAVDMLAPGLRRPPSLRSAGRRAGWLAACVAALLANPDPAAYWRIAVELARSDEVAAIAEGWQPLWTAPALAIVVIALVAVATVDLRRRPDGWRAIAPIACTAALTCTAVRHAPWLVVVVTPWVAGFAPIRSPESAVARVPRRAVLAMTAIAVAVSCVAVVTRDTVASVSGRIPDARDTGTQDLVFAPAQVAGPLRAMSGARVWFDPRLERYRSSDLRQAILLEQGDPDALRTIACSKDAPGRFVLRREDADELDGVARAIRPRDSFSDLALEPGLCRATE